MFGLLLALMFTTQIDRTYEESWYVSDLTDNNVGVREVYAFLLHTSEYDPDVVTVTMRCSNDEPVLFLEWSNLALPSQAVVTIGPVSNPDDEPLEASYIFEKSLNPLESGHRASAATSQEIIRAIGSASYAVITVHSSSGSRTLGLEVDGAPKAWNRVSRHCPATTMPQPPV